MPWLALLKSPWTYVAAAFIALGIYAGILKLELGSVRTEYAEFKTKVVTAAVAAAEQALKKTIADEQDKEKSDAENSKTTRDLRAAIERLRRARPDGGFVPPAAPGAASPERAAFDRAELERAIRSLDSGVQGLVDEGSKAVTDLNTAKEWARRD